jgi:ribose transport system ATP-binding protein
MSDQIEPLLQLTGVSKTYPGVRALNGVDFSVRRGEIHALVGENGAGKSTLINVMTGAVGTDAGEYLFDGKAAHRLTPSRALAMGVAAVFQEFALAPDLTVEENLFLGREITRAGLLQRNAMRAAARNSLDSIGFSLDLDAQVGLLSRAEQQMVEIAKALLHEAKLLILDEPTASLTESDAERLFQILMQLRDRGVAIVYVSHRMPELLRLADRITVLRDGTLITCIDAVGMTQRKIVELMSGRPADILYPVIEHRPSDIALELTGLSLRYVSDVSIAVRRGEIVGIAGLVGCGKSEVIRAVFGAEDGVSGTIEVHGKAVRKPSPSEMLSQGVAYFPADRNHEGLALNRPVFENVSLAAMDRPDFVRKGFIRRAEERGKCFAIMKQLALRPLDIERGVGTLSGGNRQKVMLGRGLARPTSIFLFDEPTVGIDVSAKLEVYEFIRELVQSGAAVILVSSELAEIIGLSHRVYVMSQGRVVGEHVGPGLTENALLEDFFYDHRNAKPNSSDAMEVSG